MYTENQLNGMTKAQIIEATLKLTNKVESLSSGPVTADAIKAAQSSVTVNQDAVKK